MQNFHGLIDMSLFMSGKNNHGVGQAIADDGGYGRSHKDFFFVQGLKFLEICFHGFLVLLELLYNSRWNIAAGWLEYFWVLEFFCGCRSQGFNTHSSKEFF